MTATISTTTAGMTAGAAREVVDPTRPLCDQVAVVTGASRGIGAATARALAPAGARVVLAARDQGKLGEVAASITHTGAGTALVVPTDVTDAVAVASLMERTVEEFDSAYATTLRSVFLGMKYAIPAIARRWGRGHRQHELHRRVAGGGRPGWLRHQQARLDRPDQRTGEAPGPVAALAGSARLLWTVGRRIERVSYMIGAVLILFGIAHLGVFALLGGPWDGPVSWRKPVTFGVAFGLTVIAVAALSSFLGPPPASGGWFVGVFVAACVVEVVLVTSQAWRHVPSHFNRDTGLDSAISSVLAAGGAVPLAVPIHTENEARREARRCRYRLDGLEESDALDRSLPCRRRGAGSCGRPRC